MERDKSAPDSEKRALQTLFKACPRANFTIMHYLELGYAPDYGGPLFLGNDHFTNPAVAGITDVNGLPTCSQTRRIGHDRACW